MYYMIYVCVYSIYAYIYIYIYICMVVIIILGRSGPAAIEGDGVTLGGGRGTELEVPGLSATQVLGGIEICLCVQG